MANRCTETEADIKVRNQIEVAEALNTLRRLVLSGVVPPPVVMIVGRDTGRLLAMMNRITEASTLGWS